MNEICLVDSHVHFWDPSQLHYPWLMKYPALNRAFLPADFSAASAKSNVRKMVFVECDYEPTQSLDEVNWVYNLAKSEARLKGIVANAMLEKGESVRAELNTLSTFPLVKGVRRNLQTEANIDFCVQPEFVAGVKLLAKFGFTFDICIRHEQLGAVVQLVRNVPEVMFILDHFGKPGVRGKITEPWAVNLRSLADMPNVVCKISGLTTEADWKTWKPADLKFYFDHALECFGFDRILFGGDWPVATLATSYDHWTETVRLFFSSATEAEQIKLFQTNAEKIYRV
jgi:L-fuconolactonase